MLKKFFFWGSAIATALVLGFAGGGTVLLKMYDKYAVENGDWKANTLTASDEAGPWMRAMSSFGGPLAQRREYSVSYRATSAAGIPLSLRCTYRVEVPEMDVAWWSITVYGVDGFLMRGDDTNHSVNSRVYDTSGQDFITLSRQHPEQGAWLAVGEPAKEIPKGRPKTDRYEFDLLLRLYGPGDAYLDSPASAPLPVIRVEDCR
ncbi:DUF1214 domain-containing protein [Biformimicrobium ophioploci]|uniref:DUF1214 domain-containing protein n=1 Tax=Biformimicrobium ophioploci TaxID=3036711 RepID=A0ABQ6LZ89_9GAMM|nr:DUF1214 domain-containing protein [Microbulbifer sp. NKW57]GMG87404.1 DUF1214 domain-containing protein [Microbulbifer sp. NKW57]